MNTNKLAFFAAAASLTFAGAAFAQSTTASPTPGQQTPPSSSPATTSTPPADSMSPSTDSTTPPASTSADSAAAPTSASVATDFKVGSEVKDPAGIVVGAISGTSVAADGSTNVVISNGDVKFALPAASLSSNAGVLSTTATKAQIDATLAGAKPQ